MPNLLLTFDDVLIVPKFSTITSRKDVSLSTDISGLSFTLPVISANMDTITGPEMAIAMALNGGVGCLHRFSSVEENIATLKASTKGSPMVSIGLGNDELKRAIALWEYGATHFVIDVAHGAQLAVVDQANALRGLLPGAYIMVGNFASDESVKEFLERARNSVNAVKVGVGPGSACTTRIKTGVGVPQLSAVMQIAKLLKNTPIHVVADGGMKTPGDIAKALGAGAHMVMLGGMLAGTDKTPGHKVWQLKNGDLVSDDVVYPRISQPDGSFLLDKNHEVKIPSFKKYRGSASKESYEVQGKTGSHFTAEGESFLVPYKGPVSAVLADIEGGIRSAMTYVGARDLDEFRARCEFAQISSATIRENGAHGKL